jgi:hypothetical protein
MKSPNADVTFVCGRKIESSCSYTAGFSDACGSIGGFGLVLAVPLVWRRCETLGS